MTSSGPHPLQTLSGIYLTLVQSGRLRLSLHSLAWFIFCYSFILSGSGTCCATRSGFLCVCISVSISSGIIHSGPARPGISLKSTMLAIYLELSLMLLLSLIHIDNYHHVNLGLKFPAHYCPDYFNTGRTKRLLDSIRPLALSSVFFAKRFWLSLLLAYLHLPPPQITDHKYIKIRDALQLARWQDPSDATPSNWRT